MAKTLNQRILLAALMCLSLGLLSCSQEDELDSDFKDMPYNAGVVHARVRIGQSYSGATAAVRSLPMVKISTIGPIATSKPGDASTLDATLGHIRARLPYLLQDGCNSCWISGVVVQGSSPSEIVVVLSSVPDFTAEREAEWNNVRQLLGLVDRNDRELFLRLSVPAGQEKDVVRYLRKYTVFENVDLEYYDPNCPCQFPTPQP